MAIELADGSSSFHPRRVEWAYGEARRQMRADNQGFAECGLRLARARHPKMLKALDVMANVIANEADAQVGRTLRDGSTPFSERVTPTEAQLLREAYRLADEHPEATSLDNFSWLYGAAAVLAGLYY